MVLGNFMLLCDIHPDAVYQWFMELFIDSYDWVMVPNVYGMSQHADGGLMTTKPYISGSSYILKMSDYSKVDSVSGDAGKVNWCEVWDALYWRFIDREREFFSSNPRMRVMVGQLDRMGAKLDHHRNVSERFLTNLHG
jgi:deoxyribodipyrimidine photolyase-related protein